MQRIRIISAVFPRPWRPEMGRFVASLAEDWSARGLAIDVVTSSTLSERLNAARRPRENVAIPGVSVDIAHTLGTPFPKFLPDALRTGLNTLDSGRIGAAMQKGERPDLIYAQFAAAGRHARKASAALKVPYVIALGESSSLLEGHAGVVAENRRALREAGGIVCVSPRLRSEALELGADPARVKLIPNYPNWDRFYPRDKAECRRALGLGQNDFLVVYLGRFSHRKGASRLNEALKRMKHPAKAAFLGSGNLNPDFDGVVHAGVVTHDDLPLWLNAADVMGLPTLAEGCCNAIAEAMACGLPLVTSDINDIRWQVPENGVLLVDPNDPDRIAEALDQLAGDTDFREQMRAALVAQIERNAGKVRADDVLGFLEQVLMDHHG